MSKKNDKLSIEELKKLEEEAYYKLCQIIEQAIQTQNIDLDEAIRQWKQDYSVVLTADIPNSTFKAKIKRLLDEDYQSEIIAQILQQIRSKIQFKQSINQLKALRELYVMIKETDDLKTLEKKVEEWKAKYPKSEFLNMYQGRRASYIRKKNLEDNAFDQDKAFDDLVTISKSNTPSEELGQVLENWKTKYSIGDKFEFDDFIKHKTDVKHYYDYLLLIANQASLEDMKSLIGNAPNSTLQDAALNCLERIAKERNNLDEIFEWVYKSSSINFDDYHKERILAATSIEYPPEALLRFQTPNINLDDPLLCLDEYNNIANIKNYTVLSYFNSLRPKESAISNDFYNKNLKRVYNKSEELKHTNKTSLSSEELLSSGIEISFDNRPSTEKEFQPEIISTKNEIDEPTLEISSSNDSEPIVEVTDSEEQAKDTTTNTITVSTENEIDEPTLEISSSNDSKPIVEVTASQEQAKDTTTDTVAVSPEKEVDELTLEISSSNDSKPVVEVTASPEQVQDTFLDTSNDIDQQNTDNNEIMFFDMVHTLTTQAEIIDAIDEKTSQSLEKEPYLEEPSKEKTGDVEIYKAKLN